MSRNAPSEQNMEHGIVAAAEELFLERGYALTSTVEIAKRAGCNQALVHYYFRTKENLFQAIFTRKLSGFIRGVVSLDAQDLPFEQALARIVEAHFDAVTADPRLPFLILNEVTTNPERLKALQTTITANLSFEALGRFEKKLAKEISKGNVRKTTLMDIMTTIGSLNVMICLMHPVATTLLKMSKDDLARFRRHRRREHVEIVLRSLKP